MSVFTNLVSGSTSFVISAFLRLFFHHSQNLKEERLFFYKHSLKANTRDVEEVQNAREMESDGTQWTRRIIAMTMPLFFITLTVLGILDAYGYSGVVSMPVQTIHHFLLFSWKTTKIIILHGYPYFPWESQFFFMIGGFYFGVKVCNK